MKAVFVLNKKNKIIFVHSYRFLCRSYRFFAHRAVLLYDIFNGKGIKILSEFKNKGVFIMKYCTKCGAEMADNASTCEKCGCGYSTAPAANVNTAPAVKLKTSRGAVKSILLSIITLGIYGIVLYYKMSSELNLTATRYDGKKTMNFALLFFLVGPLTLEIATLVWFHKFSKRIGNELKRRNIQYSFGAGSFWGWNVLGLLIIVGPFIYLHKVIKAINLINADYNING